MKISVIVPTYRPGSYLRECLDSLVKQSFDHSCYEVIVVLNGEKQVYEDKILEYIKGHKDVNFNYLYSSTPGVSKARNLGLDAAKGEYIAFIDDDDYISQNYLEELYKHAGNNIIPVCRPLSFVDGTSVYEKYAITKDFDRFHQDGRLPFYIPKRFFNGPVYKLIHRDVIGNRRFDERFKNGEDSLFMFLISDKMEYVEFAAESAIYYRRIRQNSATQSKKPFGYSFLNYSRLIIEHTIIYFKNYPHYNFRFYISSIIGRIKSIILD